MTKARALGIVGTVKRWKYRNMKYVEIWKYEKIVILKDDNFESELLIDKQDASTNLRCPLPNLVRGMSPST